MKKILDDKEIPFQIQNSSATGTMVDYAVT